MVIRLPKDVVHILYILEQNGFEAYIVGGCVRDSIIGLEPKDWDLTTSALPEQVVKLFDKVVETGMKHGTVTVILNNIGYEVTTYRVDGEYTDGRRPDSVTYTTSIEEDLARRDFTINAIAYNPKVGLVDPFNGVRDIASSRITCVGSATRRFTEDALRMLRAIRFSVRYYFNIDLETLKAIADSSRLIERISQERIRDELCKILTSNQSTRGFDLLHRTGLLKYILPEIDQMYEYNQNNPYHHLDLYEHTMTVLSNVGNTIELRLAALFHDVGKISTMTLDDKGIAHYNLHHKVGADLTSEILNRLKFDVKTTEIVATLVYNHMSLDVDISDKALKRFIERVTREQIDNCLQLMRADILGHTLPHDFKSLDTLTERIRIIIEKKEPTHVLDLNINGSVLKDLGFKPGPIFKIILEDCLDKVLDNSEFNTRKQLVAYVRDEYGNLTC